MNDIRRRKPARSIVARVLVYGLLISGAGMMILPYVFELLTSLKTYEETTSLPPTFFPEAPQWGNYASVATSTFPIFVQLGNSVIVTAARVAGQLLFTSLAAYAFARLSFPFKRTLFATLLSVLMVPGQLFLIPQYQIMQSIGWLDTLQALAIPGMFSAFGVFLLRQFFLGIPTEIDEAARLDGANPCQIYWRILLPMVRPALAALGLLTMVSAWSDLLWPIIVNSSPERLPISVGIASLSGQYTTQFQLVMAASVIASAPVIAAFLIGQKNFVRGLTAGAVK
ncbi:MAG: carbohydrate ABC transporter permease [Microbacterium sp.]